MNDSLIEWTSKTWNPVTGCSGPKVSPGCANCYAERTAKTRLAGRHGYDANDPFGIHYHQDRLFEPLRMRKPSRIFVCSMGDLFHDEVLNYRIARIFSVMARCPQHTFMLLTKRAERMHHFITDEFAHSWLGASWPEVTKQASVDLKIDAPWPLPNVWLGVTVCNQAEADAKLPVLLQTPAAKRFVSVEPMLGPVEIGKYLYGSYECALSCGHRQAFTDPPEKQCTKCGFTGPDDYATWGDGSCEECPKCGQDGCCGEIEEICPDCGTYMVREHPDTPNIDWVIAGPETGPKARAANEVWFRSLRDQCHADYCKTPFFLKKNSDGSRLLDGREWNEVPS